jgi:hypothetical protein
MAWFNKYYRCTECETEWQDQWSSLCNDRCPKCQTEIEPYDFAEVDEGSIGFIMLIPKGTDDESTPLDLRDGSVDLLDQHNSGPISHNRTSDGRSADD